MPALRAVAGANRTDRQSGENGDPFPETQIGLEAKPSRTYLGSGGNALGSMLFAKLLSAEKASANSERFEPS